MTETGPTVQVMYTCHRCRMKDREVPVPERKPDEDVVAWVKFAASYVDLDHRRASPGCSSQHVDLKIPLPSAQGSYIGQAARQ